MKYKKGLILIFLIICLFSIASVCASDVNETGVASEGQSGEVIAIEDTNEIVTFDNKNERNVSLDEEIEEIGTTDENELSATTGTFTDLANDISNADYEFNLTKNYKYAVNDFSYKNGINITKKITINGNGFIINGNNQARAFTILFPNVTISNIHFLNCYNDEDGGSVYWGEKSGDLYNCNFVNCSSGGRGGAIYLNIFHDHPVFNSSFMNCYSIKGSGAVSGSVCNSSFVNCSSRGSGGAVSGSVCNSSFVNCSSGGRGGAVSGSVCNSIFINNSAEFSGGAVSTSESIENCTFMSNTAFSGGAVSFTGNKKYIKGSIFENNYGREGSIYFDGDYNSLEYNVCLNFTDKRSGIYSRYINNKFNYNWWGSNNFSPYIYEFDKQTSVNNKLTISLILNSDNIILQNQFSDVAYVNYTGSSSNSDYLKAISRNIDIKVEEGIISNAKTGEPIYFSSNHDTGTYSTSIIVKVDSEIFIKNLTYKIILNNSFTDLNKLIRNTPQGETLNLNTDYFFNRDEDSNLINGILINKSIVINANGHVIDGMDLSKIFNIVSNNVTLINIAFQNAFSENNGAFIYWKGDNGCLENVTFLNGHVSNSKDIIDGGLIYWTGENGKLSNAIFSDCKVSCGKSNKLNSVILWNGDNGLINNISCLNFDVKHPSGNLDPSINFIYWSSLSGIIANSKFSSKVSFKSCIFSDEKNTSIQNCTCKEMGKIELTNDFFLINSDCALEFSNINSCKISNSICSRIDGTGDNVFIDNCIVNQMSLKGNNIIISKSKYYCYANGNNMKIYNCLIYGSIYGKNNSIYNCSFNNSKSITIGGINNTIFNSNFTNLFKIYFSSSGKIFNCNFKNFETKTDGRSIIYCTQKDTIIFNCSFINCSSSSECVCIESGTSDLSITKCNFINCTSFKSHGLIYMSSGVLNIRDSLFINCISKYSLIYTKYNSTIVNCSFLNNFMENGGLFNSDIRDIINCSFSNNHAGFSTSNEVILNDNLYIYSYSPGEVDILINGTILKDVLIRGSNYILIPKNISAGEHKIQIDYHGDYMYGPYTVEKIVNVKKINNYPFSIKSTNVIMGNKLEVNLPDDADGVISISTDNITFSQVFNKDNRKVDISNLKSGNYNLQIIFSNDNVYENKTINSYLHLIKSYADFNLTIVNNKVNKNTTFNIVLLNNTQGNISITFNKKELIYNLDKNNYTFDLGKLSKGKYKVEFNYSGDDNFYPFSKTVDFEVYDRIQLNKKNITIKTNFNPRGNGNIEVNLPNNITGYLLFDINNQNKYCIINNGSANFNFENMTDRQYKYYIKYMGDDDYYDFAIEDTLILFNSVKSFDVTCTLDNINFKATFYNQDGSLMLNKYIFFKINEKEYPILTNNMGVAEIMLDLIPGTYDISSINTVTNEVKINKLLVLNQSRQTPEFSVPSIDNPASGSLIPVNLPIDSKGNVTLNIDNNEYYFPIVNGVANVKLPELSNGFYEYTISYSGDDKYKSFSKTDNLTINKESNSTGENNQNSSTNSTGQNNQNASTLPTKLVTKTTIILKTVKVKKSAKKLVLQATLKKGKIPLKFKKIIFKFNGKKYTTKTNKKGIAKVTIKKKVLKKLKVGKKIKIQASYGKIIAKKTVKVKK